MTTNALLKLLCVLIYLLIGSILALCMIIRLGREESEAEIGLVTLFWPVAIVLDSLASIYFKALRLLKAVGRSIHAWSEPLIQRMRKKDA